MSRDISRSMTTRFDTRTDVSINDLVQIMSAEVPVQKRNIGASKSTMLAWNNGRLSAGKDAGL